MSVVLRYHDNKFHVSVSSTALTVAIEEQLYSKDILFNSHVDFLTMCKNVRELTEDDIKWERGENESPERFIHIRFAGTDTESTTTHVLSQLDISEKYITALEKRISDLPNPHEYMRDVWITPDMLNPEVKVHPDSTMSTQYIHEALDTLARDYKKMHNKIVYSDYDYRINNVKQLSYTVPIFPIYLFYSTKIVHSDVPIQAAPGQIVLAGRFSSYGFEIKYNPAANTYTIFTRKAPVNAIGLIQLYPHEDDEDGEDCMQVYLHLGDVAGAWICTVDLPNKIYTVPHCWNPAQYEIFMIHDKKLYYGTDASLLMKYSNRRIPTTD